MAALAILVALSAATACAGAHVATPGVPASRAGLEGTWELVYDPGSNTILHFNFR